MSDFITINHQKFSVGDIVKFKIGISLGKSKWKIIENRYYDSVCSEWVYTVKSFDDDGGLVIELVSESSLEKI